MIFTKGNKKNAAKLTNASQIKLNDEKWQATQRWRSADAVS